MEDLPRQISRRSQLQLWINFILKAHKLVVTKSNEPNYILPATAQKLESIVTSSLNYYDSPKQKALSLFYLIIKDHPFLNANKRTAVAVLLFLYEHWNLGTQPDAHMLKDISLQIAKGELSLREVFKRFRAA